jgi:hypothetical protein
MRRRTHVMRKAERIEAVIRTDTYVNGQSLDSQQARRCPWYRCGRPQ